MYRLKLTLKNGKEFLSPFVYNLNKRQMKRKVLEMSWLLYEDYIEDGEKKKRKIHKLEFFEVTQWPELAIFKEVWFKGTNDIDRLDLIKFLEEEWDKLMKGEEDYERED